MRRITLPAVALAASFAIAAAMHAAAEAVTEGPPSGSGNAPPSFRLNYIGHQLVPNKTRFNGTTVGGLSSLDYDPASGRYLAVSDDRSKFNPARFYELSLDLARFTRSATPGMDGVTFHSVTTIQRTMAPFSLMARSTRKACAWTPRAIKYIGVMKATAALRAPETRQCAK